MERLESSLATALEAFPPLTSGIVDLEGARFGLAPLATPPRWLDVRETSGLPDDSIEPQPLGAWVPRLFSGPDQPLFSARLTRAPSASILTATMSHAVADGYSFFSFMRAWSRAALGRSPHPPLWDRRLLDVDPRPCRAVTPEEVWRRTGFSWLPGRSGAPPGMQPASFGGRLVPPDLKPLASGGAFSDNDLLSAWLLHEYGARLAGPEGLAVTFPIDYRRCFGDDRLSSYFGNAVRFAPLWIERAAIERATLPELATLVQGAVRDVCNERGARDSLECIEQLQREQGRDALGELHTVHPHTGFLVTNVSRLPLGTLDFGKGPPVRALLPAAEERASAIQQADGGFEVSLFLPTALSAPA